MNNESIDISKLEQLQQVAEQLSHAIEPGAVVHLEGDLGAGKTTFCQLFLQACGVTGPVKSPTYTLYEAYSVADRSFVHMDLYRLTDPEELYFLGIEDLINGHNIILVEWPEKGKGVLPGADWVLTFSLNQLNRTLTITSKQ